jgi:hypothetical protein
MKRSTFIKRLKESARSRAGMASNPLIRAACDLQGAKVEKVETSMGTLFNVFNWGQTEAYGGSINLTQWAAYEGDGEYADHAWFVEKRYGLDKDDFDFCVRTMASLNPELCYLVEGSRFGRLVWKMFATDYG